MDYIVLICVWGGFRLIKIYPDDPQTYNQQFNGYVSNLIIHNRYLAVNEIDSFYARRVYTNAVFLMAGQSNMSGNSSWNGSLQDMDKDYALHEGRVSTFNMNDNIDITGGIPSFVQSDITNNAQHPIGFIDADQTKQTGMWKTFCDDYIRYSGLPYDCNIVLIPSARGGSSLSEWNNNNGLGGALIIGSNACLQTTPDGVEGALETMGNGVTRNFQNKLCGFFWAQGEKDIVNLNTDYKTEFYEMITRFEAQISGFTNDLPIVLANIHGDYNKYVTGSTSMKMFMNNVFNEIAAENPNRVRIVDTADFKYIRDGIHYDIEYTREAGYRYYNKFMELIGGSNSKPLQNEKILISEKNNEVKMNSLVSFPYMSGMTNLTMNAYFEKTYEFPVSGCSNNPIVTMKFLRLGSIVHMLVYGFRLEPANSYINLTNDSTNVIDEVFRFHTIANNTAADRNKFFLCPVRENWTNVASEETITDSVPIYFKLDRSDGTMRITYGELLYSDIETDNFRKTNVGVAVYGSGGCCHSYIGV